MGYGHGPLGRSVALLVVVTTVVAAATGTVPAVWGRSIPGTMAMLRQLGHTPQLDVWRSSQGLTNATRYVRDCTSPSDRLLVTWYAPEVYFFAERMFAGGQAYFYPGFFTSLPDQRRVIDRLASESVPVVLTHSERYAAYFASEYPFVDAYLRREFRPAGSSTAMGARVSECSSADAPRRRAPMPLPGCRASDSDRGDRPAWSQEARHPPAPESPGSVSRAWPETARDAARQECARREGEASRGLGPA